MLTGIGQRIADYLQRPEAGYAPFTPSDPDDLRRALRPGDVAQRTVKAPFTFSYPAHAEHDRAREEAYDSALQVYLHRADLVDDRLEQLGIEVSRKYLAAADLILLCVEAWPFSARAMNSPKWMKPCAQARLSTPTPTPWPRRCAKWVGFPCRW